jgi:hypothetical protein
VIADLKPVAADPACRSFGFAIGIAGQRPDPVQHPKLHASASINGVPAIMRDH